MIIIKYFKDDKRSNTMKMILSIMSLFIVLITTHARARLNPPAEQYISKMLNKEIPYQVKILDYTFIINSVHSYPPGNLTAMFAKYLIDNHLIQNKVVADVGCGCFALGIISAKSGANTIIGTDINEYAIKCAKDNLLLNDVRQQTYLFVGEGLSTLLPDFTRKIDVILAGVPWDSIPSTEFTNITHERQYISRAFYDIDDKLITNIMLHGFSLLTPKGKVFITSSVRTLDRIKKLCSKYNIRYKIVSEADLHGDGNIHYILELSKVEWSGVEA